MGQHNVVVRLEQHQLIPQARFPLAERVHPSSDRRDTLPEVEVEALHKGRLGLSGNFRGSQLPDFLCK